MQDMGRETVHLEGIEAVNYLLTSEKEEPILLWKNCVWTFAPKAYYILIWTYQIAIKKSQQFHMGYMKELFVMWQKNNFRSWAKFDIESQT